VYESGHKIQLYYLREYAVLYLKENKARVLFQGDETEVTQGFRSAPHNN
jgi:hypothetical protein